MERDVLRQFIKVALGIGAVMPLVPAIANDTVLAEVIVTAQKREQNIQDVPISIGVLSADALANRSIIDVTQLIQMAPSINFKDGYSPIATSLSIRGVNSYTFDGGIQPSISVVVDGVPLARAGEFIQELADIERIEVLRGPQGTLFGQNATGGAINIVRKGPTDEFEGLFEVSATDDSDFMVKGSLSGPISDRVRGRLSVFKRDFRGFIRNYSDNGKTGRWLGGTDSYGAVGKLAIDVSDDMDLLLSVDFRKSTHGNSPQIATISEGFDFNFNGLDDRIEALGNGDFALGSLIYADPYKTSVSKVADEFENEGMGATADLTWRLNDSGLIFKSITTVRSFDDRNNPDVDGTPADGNRLVTPIVSVTTSDAPTCCNHSRRQYHDYVSQELRLSQAGDSFDWTVGAFYLNLHETVKNSVALLILDAFVDPASGGAAFGGTPAYFDEYFLQDQRIYGNRANLESTSIFADVTFHLSDRTDVFAGIRYTQEDIETNLKNYTGFGPLSFAAIASRFNTSTMVLDTTGIPEFPAGGPTSVGTASNKENATAGRLGLSFAVSDDFNLYAVASRGFIGAGAKLSRSARTNDAFLKPSEADAVELGMKSALAGGRIRLNGAIFSQKTKELQASRLIPGTVNSEIVNAGNLKTKGAELDASFLVNDNLSLDVSVALLDSEFENLTQPCYPGQTAAQGCTATGQVIDGQVGLTSPEVKYSVGLNAAVPVGSLTWFGSIGYVWQDDMHFNLDHDPLTIQKAYGLLDMNIGLRRDDKYSISFFAKNLADEQYMNSREAAFGALGRVFVRPARDGNRYFGLKLSLNF